MSAGRIAGQKSTVGFREKPLPGCRARDDLEAMRIAFHDHERRHGRRVRRASTGRAWTTVTESAPQRQRQSAGTWQERFVVMLVRTGELQSAARMARVSYPTVRSNISRNLLFRQKCREAMDGHTMRMLRLVASGKMVRWALSQRRAVAIMAALEKA